LPPVAAVRRYNNMVSCPLYRADDLSRCGAIGDDVTPTLHERERFCCSLDYVLCPTLQTMVCLRRRLREDEYLAIWMPPAHHAP
jgi:hypothetical protein